MIITINDIDCIFDSYKIGKIKNPKLNSIKYKNFKIYLYIDDEDSNNLLYYCKITDLFNNKIEYGYKSADCLWTINNAKRIINETDWSYLKGIKTKLIYYHDYFVGSFLEYLHKQLDKYQ